MFGQYQYKPLLAADAQKEEKHVETLQSPEKKLQASNGLLELQVKELKRLQSLEEAVKHLLQCDDKNASETLIKNKYEELKRLHHNEIELLTILDNFRIEYYRQRYTSYSYSLILPEKPAQAGRQHVLLHQLDALGIKYHWQERAPSSYLMVLTENNETTIDSAHIALRQYKKELQKKLELINIKIKRKEAEVEYWANQTSGFQSVLDKDKDQQVTTEYVRLTG